MPVYDLKCPCCEKIVRDEFVHSHKDEVKCPRCRAVMKRLVSSSKFVAASVFPSEGIHFPNAGPDGKTFYSKKEMRTFEKETGMTIGMLH